MELQLGREGGSVPSRLGRWAIWAIVVLGATLICMVVVDRPLAELAASHQLHLRGIQFVIGMPGLLLGLALIAPMLNQKMPNPALKHLILLCSQAIIWTAAAVELVLKRIFGRAGPYEWLGHGDFSFHWFRGSVRPWQSMPSGEAALLAAAIGVLWVALPRWRWFYIGVGVLEAVGLVWLNWHFMSDVVAGAGFGIVGAGLAVSNANRQK